MPQITASIDAQRESIRETLNEITNDIAMELRDADLGSIPVYLVVPNSGDAIATAATPLDPSEDEWSQVLEIACRVIQRRIGSGKPRSRELACTAINTAITSADVTSE
jgi:hypothetical protein